MQCFLLYWVMVNTSPFISITGHPCHERGSCAAVSAGLLLPPSKKGQTGVGNAAEVDLFNIFRLSICGVSPALLRATLQLWGGSRDWDVRARGSPGAPSAGCRSCWVLPLHPNPCRCVWRWFWQQKCISFHFLLFFFKKYPCELLHACRSVCLF